MCAKAVRLYQEQRKSGSEQLSGSRNGADMTVITDVAREISDDFTHEHKVSSLL